MAVAVVVRPCGAHAKPAARNIRLFRYVLKPAISQVLVQHVVAIPCNVNIGQSTPLTFAAVFNLLGNFDWEEHFEDA